MGELDDWNRRIIEEFRSNGGRVGGRLEGANLLLLHTTGARSGRERVNPLAYQAVGDDYAVFGSNAGASINPDWYHNLLANPDVTVEVGTETFKGRARVAEGDERDRIWARQKELVPSFDQYEEKTTRPIPVVVISRS
jgi:deazaflavin-dependent oxidoreductase (nitroreductase family)